MIWPQAMVNFISINGMIFGSKRVLNQSCQGSRELFSVVLNQMRCWVIENSILPGLTQAGKQQPAETLH